MDGVTSSPPVIQRRIQDLPKGGDHGERAERKPIRGSGGRQRGPAGAEPLVGG